MMDFPTRTLAVPGSLFGPPALTRVVLDGSIPKRFEEVASVVPSRVAIRAPAGEMRYAHLQRLSDRLASGLLAQLWASRQRAPAPVVVLLAQGIPAIATQLAILKAGCFYVPLGPRHPVATLGALVDHVQPALVVVDAATADIGASAAAGRVPVVDFDTLDSNAIGPSALPVVDAHALAYVYCTSGSTGRPKGVADTHRNVLHNVLRYTRTLGIGPVDRLSLLQSPAFSGAVSSTWCALLNGATLCPYDVLADGPDGLADWIADCGITVYHSVPSVFRRLATGRRSFPQLRIIRLEGDRALASDVALYQAHFPRTCTLVNGLGTTETGLVRQLFVDHDTTVSPGLLPVGFAVDEMEVMVVAPDGTSTPRGDVGEIAVRSRFLAQGYWRDEGLTRSKFVATSSDPTTRVYRTGDLGRMRGDGCLEYLGRGDSLVKVRGESVDLSLVEQALTAHPGVRDAAAIPRLREDGETEIVALVTSVPGSDLTGSGLRAVMREQVPPIMIPAVIAMRESLPLTPHGKLDRKALASLVSGTGNEALSSRPGRTAAVDSHQERSRPRSAIEVQVMRIWEQVLGQSPIGMEDDFFDLGGDSLQAAELVFRIRQLFERELPLDTLWFRGRTVRGLARLLLEDEADPVWCRPVPFKRIGDMAPLFCLPVAGGHLYFYDALARHIGPDRPVYGLPPRGLDGRQPAQTSVEAMADFAIGQMRTIQPAGPYHLVGFCGGGVLAFEVARQLRSQGEEVGLLALVDSPMPARWAGMLEDLGAPKERWRLVQERVYAITLNALRMPRLRRLKGVGESHRWALWSYRPRPLDGRILLINPRDDPRVRRSERNWRPLAREGVDVALLPGKHGDLVKEPGVALLAERIDAYLAPAFPAVDEPRSDDGQGQ